MSTIYAPAQSPHGVALCDCCDERPGTALVIMYGIETWVCDVCADGDREPEEAPEENPSA